MPVTRLRETERTFITLQMKAKAHDELLNNKKNFTQLISMTKTKTTENDILYCIFLISNKTHKQKIRIKLRETVSLNQLYF